MPAAAVRRGGSRASASSRRPAAVDNPTTVQQATVQQATVQQATRSMQHATCGMQRAACNVQHTTCSIQCRTCNKRHTMHNVSDATNAPRRPSPSRCKATSTARALRGPPAAVPVPYCSTAYSGCALLSDYSCQTAIISVATVATAGPAPALARALLPSTARPCRSRRQTCRAALCIGGRGGSVPMASIGCAAQSYHIALCGSLPATVAADAILYIARAPC